MGVVRTAAGSGPTSCAIVVARPSAGMSTMLRPQTATQAFAMDDVVATRIALETAVVGTLATSAVEFEQAQYTTFNREPQPVSERQRTWAASQHPDLATRTAEGGHGIKA